MIDTIYSSEGYYLQKLQYYLNYEIASSVLFFLSFEVGIFLYLAAAAAIVFTPFMLYFLYRGRKIGWMIAFSLIVFIPLIIGLFAGLPCEFGRMILIITIALFYFYCFILRYTVKDWIDNINAKQKYQMEKLARDQELKGFMEQFKD